MAAGCILTQKPGAETQIPDRRCAEKVVCPNVVDLITSGSDAILASEFGRRSETRLVSQNGRRRPDAAL